MHLWARYFFSLGDPIQYHGNDLVRQASTEADASFDAFDLEK